ncbi:hypothetical protein PUN28_006642 [Cardiocondyla obscurior]|uniref:Uncharacterized protein n=1 Tax=Cardiocondyla obscurior TaxID=286306 RepID=A0AAW2GFR8_9HYME
MPGREESAKGRKKKRRREKKKNRRKREREGGREHRTRFLGERMQSVSPVSRFVSDWCRVRGSRESTARVACQKKHKKRGGGRGRWASDREWVSEREKEREREKLEGARDHCEEGGRRCRVGGLGPRTLLQASNKSEVTSRDLSPSRCLSQTLLARRRKMRNTMVDPR